MPSSHDKPTPKQTFKDDWQKGDYPTAESYNKINGALNRLVGNPTGVDPPKFDIGPFRIVSSGCDGNADLYVAKPLTYDDSTDSWSVDGDHDGYCLDPRAINTEVAVGENIYAVEERTSGFFLPIQKGVGPSDTSFRGSDVVVALLEDDLAPYPPKRTSGPEGPNEGDPGIRFYQKVSARVISGPAGQLTTLDDVTGLPKQNTITVYASTNAVDEEFDELLEEGTLETLRDEVRNSEAMNGVYFKGDLVFAVRHGVSKYLDSSGVEQTDAAGPWLVVNSGWHTFRGRAEFSATLGQTDRTVILLDGPKKDGYILADAHSDWDEGDSLVVVYTRKGNSAGETEAGTTLEGSGVFLAFKPGGTNTSDEENNKRIIDAIAGCGLERSGAVMRLDQDSYIGPNLFPWGDCGVQGPPRNVGPIAPPLPDGNCPPGYTRLWIDDDPPAGCDPCEESSSSLSNSTSSSSANSSRCKFTCVKNDFIGTCEGPEKAATCIEHECCGELCDTLEAVFASSDIPGYDGKTLIGEWDANNEEYTISGVLDGEDWVLTLACFDSVWTVFDTQGRVDSWSTSGQCEPAFSVTAIGTIGGDEFTITITEAANCPSCDVSSSSSSSGDDPVVGGAACSECPDEMPPAFIMSGGFVDSGCDCPSDLDGIRLPQTGGAPCIYADNSGMGGTAECGLAVAVEFTATEITVEIQEQTSGILCVSYTKSRSSGDNCNTAHTIGNKNVTGNCSAGCTYPDEVTITPSS